jgi:glycerol-3-phosphate acyltransferase PlsY
VLLVEMSKGAAAVLIGEALASDPGAVIGGLAAVAGNVYNIWYRGQGGKGLGITAGVLLAAWPTVLGPLILILVIAILITRSSGLATLVSIAALLVMSVPWSLLGWPTGWGVGNGALLVALSAGVGALIFDRHWRDSPLSEPSRPRYPEPGSRAPR